MHKRTALFAAVIVAALTTLPADLVGSATAHVAAAPVKPRLQRVALDDTNPSPEVLVAPFNAVGLSWDRDGAPTGVTVSVRVREAQGWSDWNQLDVLDIGPDEQSNEGAATAGRVATEPLLTKGADAVQVRVDSHGTRLNNMRADLVDAGRSAADGTSASPTAGTRAAGHLSVGAGQMTAQTASAPGVPSGSPPMPYVISRAQWGADESLRSHAPEYSPAIQVGVIHHTVTTNDYSPSDSYAEIRAIYAYHTLSLGWNDIAYNVLVDKYGQIFEGRAGGLDKAVLPAAHAPFNTNTFAMSALGNYQDVQPSPYMLESISQFFAWKLSINYVDPLGSSALMSRGFEGSPYPAGTWVTFPNIIGHRDVYATACPGQYLYAYLDAIRGRVKQLTAAGLVKPTIATKPRTPTANGSVRITAGLLYGGQWSVRLYRPNGSLLNQWNGSGSAIDVTWPMLDLLLPAPEGIYPIVITSNQNGFAARPFNGAASTSGIIGNFESVDVTPNGTVATGWASGTTGDEVTITLTVDGGSPVQVTANGYRADVADTYPALGPNRGFSGYPAIPVGDHLVCAWAAAQDTLPALLGCRSFDNPGNNPFGNVDHVRPMEGGLRIDGWAIDRNTAGPVTVRLYVDGGYAGDVVAATNRPDVAAVYGAYGAQHGFDVMVNTGVGSHAICVTGLNIGAGTGEGPIRCVYGTTTSGPPVGHLDALSGTETTVTALGWALDPDTTAPISVHIYVDGVYAGAFTASASRPDLASSYPFMGTAHGFAATVPRLAGSHTVCAYGINVGPPTANSWLGCASYT